MKMRGVLFITGIACFKYLAVHANIQLLTPHGFLISTVLCLKDLPCFLLYFFLLLYKKTGFKPLHNALGFFVSFNIVEMLHILPNEIPMTAKNLILLYSIK